MRCGEASLGERNTDFWAPHVSRHDDVYFMYYSAILTPRTFSCLGRGDLAVSRGTLHR